MSPLRALAALALIAPLSALAAPELLPVHGNLTDADGILIEGQQQLTFTLYSDAAGTEPVWTDTQTVELLSGNFTAYLGGAEPLDLAIFRDIDDLWLGVRVGDDEETDLARLGSVGFAGFAQFAGDALALDGVPAGELFDSIPDQIAVEDWSKAVCFDTVDELSAELDPLYALQAGDGVDLTGNVVSVVETDLKALLDDDYALSAGDGIDLTGNVVSVVEADLQTLLDDDYGFSAGTGLALDTATLEFSVEEQDLKDLLDDDYALTFGDGLELDTATNEVTVVEDDLTDLLDDNYLELEYVPDFGDLTGVPTGLADGDDDTTYTAGTGLTLSGTEFTVNQGTIEGWAKAVAFDTTAELTAALDATYMNTSGDTMTGNLRVQGTARFDSNVTGLTATLTSCSWVRDRCELDGGALVYLDRANNLSCPANKVLTQFDVINCGGGNYRMDYYCCSIAVQ